MTTRVSSCLVAGIALCVSIPLAAPAGRLAEDRSIAVLESSYSNVNRFVLDNGMVCLIKEDHSAPVVSVHVWIGTGSIHEQENLGGGLSHYVEHMIFKGTRTRKGVDITRDIDNAGGSINAYTGHDRTVIHADLPSSAWKTGLDVLSDAVMNSTFPEDEWEREKNVILREIAMNRDDPDRVLGNLLWRTAYAVHPYRFPVIGIEGGFKQMTRTELLGYFNRRYVPANMVAVVVGDIDATEVETELRRIFAGYQKMPGQPVVLPREPRQLSLRVAKETGAYNVSRLEIAFHTVPLTDKDVPALDILANVAGQGNSSRLVSELRDRRKLVHEISAWSYTPQEPGLFGISAVFDPEKEQEVLSAIREQIALWRRGKFSSEEVGKAVRMMVASEIGGLQTMGGQADSMASGELFAHDPAFAVTYLRGLGAVTPKSLAAVADKYLTSDNETVAILSPNAPGQTSGAISAVKGMSEVQKITLRNGCTLLVREDHRLPFVYLFAGCRGGQLSERDGEAGMARLMADLLVRGTRKMTAGDIASAVESMGASISPFSGRNSFGLQGRCLAGDLERFTGLFAGCLLQPAFPAEEVEKQKALQIAGIERQHEDPMFLAQEAMGAIIHTNHPYRVSELGTAGSVMAVSRDQIVDHYRRHVVTSNLVLAVFGDISREGAVDLAEKYLGRVRQGPPPEYNVALAEPALPARAELRVPKEQTIILAGFPGVRITDARADALNVLDTAASGLSSDLGVEVREKRGLAYYVGAYQRVGIDPGMFVLYAGIKREALAETEKIFGDEIGRLVTQGIRQEEFDRARKQIVAAHEMRLQDNLSVAMDCVLNELYGLGYKYSFSTKDRMAALTPADVQAAAASILLTNRMAVTVLMPEAKEKKP